MPTKDITISVQLLTTLAIKSREYFITDNIEGIVDKIRAADPEGEIVHIQQLPEATNEHGNTRSGLYKIWLQKYWMQEVERAALVKEQSEKQNALLHKRNADIEYLAERIMEKMKLEPEKARDMAAAWYTNNQTALIEMFLGSDIKPVKNEEFHWKKV